MGVTRRVILFSEGVQELGFYSLVMQKKTDRNDDLKAFNCNIESHVQPFCAVTVEKLDVVWTTEVIFEQPPNFVSIFSDSGNPPSSPIGPINEGSLECHTEWIFIGHP